jgi:hypothetical protein
VEINLVHSKSCMRWRWHLKGLSRERGWSKPVANLVSSPFKRDLSNDTTFSTTNLAGQFLKAKFSAECKENFPSLKAYSAIQHSVLLTVDKQKDFIQSLGLRSLEVSAMAATFLRSVPWPLLSRGQCHGCYILEFSALASTLLRSVLRPAPPLR